MRLRRSGRCFMKALLATVGSMVDGRKVLKYNREPIQQWTLDTQMSSSGYIEQL